MPLIPRPSGYLSLIDNRTFRLASPEGPAAATMSRSSLPGLASAMVAEVNLPPVAEA